MFGASLLTVALAITQAIAGPIPSKGGVQFAKKDSTGWDYESGIIRGINLGGWFVLEPFITPSLFEAFGSDESAIPVDEYHYTQYLGQTEASSRLQAHWSTWITESDFENIAAAGLNMVRIPIGYWAFVLKDDDPYVQGQTEYLDSAIEWARTYGLKVWIDLHGAAGSQNGFDNSGYRDATDFLDSTNMDVTLTALQSIFNKYGSSSYDDVIIGIELLNEPLTPTLGEENVLQFTEWAYGNLRSVSNQNAIVHDGFTASGYFDDKLLLNDYWGIVIDHHHYQVFSTGELSRTIDEHISVACTWGDEAVAEYHWNVAGEWSAALTDCAKWLNGVNRGARWDATYDSSTYFGSCENSQDFSSYTDDQKVNHRKYIEAQLDTFEKRGGWIFWTWKTETTLEWDFQQLTSTGLFPSPLTDRTYPGQCS